jgi:hypothetical protein
VLVVSTPVDGRRLTSLSIPSTPGKAVDVWRDGVAAARAEVLMTVGPGERIAEKQAALRRVATLVAGAATPEGSVQRGRRGDRAAAARRVWRLGR